MRVFDDLVLAATFGQILSILKGINDKKDMTVNIYALYIILIVMFILRLAVECLKLRRPRPEAASQTQELP